MALDYTIDAFRGTGYDGAGPLDLSYFKNIPNESVAYKALELVSNPSFILQLGKHHTEIEINDLKRAVYRSCIALGVPLPSRCAINARMLGVVVP